MLSRMKGSIGNRGIVTWLSLFELKSERVSVPTVTVRVSFGGGVGLKNPSPPRFWIKP